MTEESNLDVLDPIDPVEPLDLLVWVDPSDLVARPPFSDLFPINPETQDAITESMRVKGFHISKPIDVWRTEHEYVVVDGRTRMLSAVTAGIKWVPICCHDFANEDEAVDFAIANQRDRRNMTDANILRCIELRDTRRPRGGDRRSEEARSNGSREPFGQTSEEETAKAVRTSPAKVKRARTVLNAADTDPDLKEDVLAGVKSLNKAEKEVRERKRERKKKEAEEHVAVPPVTSDEPPPVDPDLPLDDLLVHPEPPVDPDLPLDDLLVHPEPPVDPDAPAPIASEIDLRDEERAWLEFVPLRPLLVNPRKFDLDVLVYLRFERAFMSLREEVFQRTGTTAPEFAGPLYAAVDRFGSIPPPDTWTLCETCQGAGLVGDEDCSKCHGGGYAIPGF